MCNELSTGFMTMRQWDYQSTNEVAICTRCNNALASSEVVSDYANFMIPPEFEPQGHKVEEMASHLYHSHPNISNSDLGRIHKSVLAWEYSKMNPIKQTQALLIGSAFHDLTLQPDVFNREYALAIKVDKRTKQGKADYAAFLEENTGKTILDQETWDLIHAMLDSFLQDDYANQVLAYGLKEESYFWTDKNTGIECKCRPDILVKLDANEQFIDPKDADCDERWLTSAIFDLKTCSCASLLEFQSSIGRWSYDRQAAHYSRGVFEVTGKPVSEFIFIPVEKLPPHDFAFYKLDSESFEVGEQLVDSDLRKLKEHDPKKEKGLCKEVQSISLPKYKLDIERR